jgi:hypothetical protein
VSQPNQGYYLDLIGDSHGSLGRHEEAVEAYCRAALEFHACGTEHAYAACLLKIAISYRALRLDRYALRYLDACLPLLRELGLAKQETAALRELAACRVQCSYAGGAQ